MCNKSAEGVYTASAVALVRLYIYFRFRQSVGISILLPPLPDIFIVRFSAFVLWILNPGFPVIL